MINIYIYIYKWWSRCAGCARNYEDIGGAQRGSRGSEFTRIWIDKNLKLDIHAQWQRL